MIARSCPGSATPLALRSTVMRSLKNRKGKEGGRVIGNHARTKTFIRLHGIFGMRSSTEGGATTSICLDIAQLLKLESNLNVEILEREMDRLLNRPFVSTNQSRDTSHNRVRTCRGLLHGACVGDLASGLGNQIGCSCCYKRGQGNFAFVMPHRSPIEAPRTSLKISSFEWHTRQEIACFVTTPNRQCNIQKLDLPLIGCKCLLIRRGGKGVFLG